jgi:hypothetical protein
MSDYVKALVVCPAMKRKVDSFRLFEKKVMNNPKKRMFGAWILLLVHYFLTARAAELPLIESSKAQEIAPLPVVPQLPPKAEVRSERQRRLLEQREARVRALAARAEAAKARGPKPKLFHPDLAPFDANRNGFLEPAEIEAYQADFARRRAEAAKQ